MKKVAIIGTGYAGLVSGAGLSDFGNRVICADILIDKINLLKNGTIPIYEPGLKELVDKNVDANRLVFTTDVKKAILESEVIFIAVGTPEGDDGKADMTAVYAVANTIAENINEFKIICTKSTVPIGSGKTICEIIEKYPQNIGMYEYVSNPEFLREGSAVKDFLWPDRVVIGAESQKAFDIMRDIYRPLYINETPIMYTNVATAEMIKYAANGFLALKISYINEIANLCEEVGADVHDVARAMGKDGRISPKFLHPGPGFGGSCFPKDTQAIVSTAKEKNVSFDILQAAIKTNKSQKIRMAYKLKGLVNDDLKNKTIGILGLAFKPNTDDVRESSAIDIIEFIISQGGEIKAYDPIANQAMKEYFPNINYCNSWEMTCEGVNAIAIMTEWNEFRSIDLIQLKSLMIDPIILDTRNILDVEQLTKLGFLFDNVGRPKKNKMA